MAGASCSVMRRRPNRACHVPDLLPENWDKVSQGETKMTDVKHLLSRTYKIALQTLNYVAVVLIFYLSVSVTADVVARFAFNHPIPGTTELVRLCMVLVIFLAFPYTMHEDRHIRTTAIAGHFPPVVRLCVDTFAFVLGATLFALLCIFASKSAWTSWVVREFEGVQLRVPTFPARLAIVIGGGFLSIECLIKAWKSFRLLFGRRYEQKDEKEE